MAQRNISSKKRGERRTIKPATRATEVSRRGKRCEVCGNEYDKTLEVVVDGRSHFFDSFECAIQALAPSCEHCGCRIIGHGVEAEGVMFCCAHCAKQAGVGGLRDRAGAEAI